MPTKSKISRTQKIVGQFSRGRRNLPSTNFVEDLLNYSHDHLVLYNNLKISSI